MRANNFLKFIIIIMKELNMKKYIKYSIKELPLSLENIQRYIYIEDLFVLHACQSKITCDTWT